MKAQHLKLMQMIHICVNGLDRMDRIVPAVQSLGRRHVGYGVRNGDYDTVGAALLWTLEQGLGDSFDAEVKEAWTNVYGVLAGAMTGAANEASERSGYAVEDGQNGGHGHEEEEAGHRAAVSTQDISPALYGTGIVDEVSGRIGQVDLLETGLNVLAGVSASGTIDEANEGMEIVTGVPREKLLGTDAFSYFTEPELVRSWFVEAVQGSTVRNKIVEVVHQEGETTPLTYTVIATLGNDQSGGVLLCRYRTD